MISAPILKSFTSYLSNVDGISAVYDENFVLQWSNSDFFKNFDITEIKSRQLICETHFKILYKNESAVLTVTPVYKSKRVVDAYTFSVRNVYQIYKMLGCSAASDYLPIVFDDYKQQTSNLIEMNKSLMESARTRKDTDILNNQNRILSTINNDLDAFSKSLFVKKEPITVNCNLSLLMSTICKDAAYCLNDIKRSLNVKLDKRNYYTKINFEPFVIAVANILNCHLALSPLKSAITVNTCCEKEKYFHVIIKSKPKKDNTDLYSVMYAAYKRDLAEKAIKSDCDGIFKYSDDEKSVVTEFKLPVFLKNRGSMLTSRNSAYLDPDYKPVRAMLKKAVESEIEQLEEIKMEAAKKKKLDSIN